MFSNFRLSTNSVEEKMPDSMAGKNSSSSLQDLKKKI